MHTCTSCLNWELIKEDWESTYLCFKCFWRFYLYLCPIGPSSSLDSKCPFPAKSFLAQVIWIHDGDRWAVVWNTPTPAHQVLKTCLQPAGLLWGLLYGIMWSGGPGRGLFWDWKSGRVSLCLAEAVGNLGNCLLPSPALWAGDEEWDRVLRASGSRV